MRNTFDILRRTYIEFSEHKLTDWAAALTYYGLLAIFPALIALVSIVGLFADPQAAGAKLTEIVDRLGPASATQTFAGPIHSITSHRSTAGVLFAVGLAGALLSASGYVGAFTRASNVVYDTREDRPAWKLRPLQLLLTLVIVLLAAATGIALVLTGPVVDAVAGPLGIGSTATTVWGIAKWPAMLVFLLVVVALLYYVTPNCRRLGFRWLSAGGVVAIALWLLASAVFAFYVSHFGSYDKTYGTLGGVVVLLVWLWIGNVALLFGHQLNAVRERNSFPPPPQG